MLLPDGDGIELLREIRATPDDAATRPVLMLSTEAEVKDRIRGLQTGADEYVGKPYDTGYVVARARELLRERRRSRRAAGATVLVIDDSATFREALRDALEAAGYARAHRRQRRGGAAARRRRSGPTRSSSTACCPASTAPP